MGRTTKTSANKKVKPDNISKGARIQELRSNLALCIQNGQTIAAYYASLKKIWDELSNYISLPACGVCKSLWLTKEREEEKIHQFLMGLDDVYVTARSNLLSRDPLPPLERIYELLLAQEDLTSCCSDRQRRSHRRLPEDLLPDILSRLPVKCLLRFRCVSKPWLALIDDRDFARLHLNAFKNNSDETRLFVLQGKEGYVRCIDTFEPISETPWFWFVVSSVDGLILLKSRLKNRIGGLSNALRLWNPSIRELRYLPPLLKTQIAPPGGPPLTDIDIGLGYDPLAKDYKVVKLVFASKTNRLHSVAIYTVGGGSWKIIPFSSSEWHWRYCRSYIGRSVHLNGSLYFIARLPDDHRRMDLVSFDLSNEVFSVVAAKKPDKPYFLNNKKLALIDGGSSLAVSDSPSSVWVLDNERMYWTERFSHPWHTDEILFFKKKGDILTARTHEDTFSDKHGNVRSGTRKEVASYSPQKQEYKILQEYRGDDFSSITHVSAYVESLILLNKSITSI